MINGAGEHLKTASSSVVLIADSGYRIASTGKIGASLAFNAPKFTYDSSTTNGSSQGSALLHFRHKGAANLLYSDGSAVSPTTIVSVKDGLYGGTKWGYLDGYGTLGFGTIQ